MESVDTYLRRLWSALVRVEETRHTLGARERAEARYNGYLERARQASGPRAMLASIREAVWHVEHELDPCPFS